MGRISQGARRALAHRATRLSLIACLLALVGFYGIPEDTGPLALSYQLKLAEAGDGLLTVRMTVTGSLPRKLSLMRPTGPFGVGTNEVVLTPIEACHPGVDGEPDHLLPIEVIDGGWQIQGSNRRWLTVVYRVDLPPAMSIENDIRHHLTVPMAGGFRGLGFHIFLVPEGRAIESTTVSFQKADGHRLVVPWPQQGWSAAADSVPIYRPMNIDDMLNSIIAWGDLRVTERELGFCHLRTAVGGEWIFSERDLVSLLSRIARTETEFFGSTPRPQINCIVAPNPVLTNERFDFYGLHLGQSILLLLDRGTSHADLAEKAAAVVAHEMFHAWLGEAIVQEDIGTLWFTEGLTTWYTYRMLMRAHVWTPDRAREVMGKRVQGHYYENGLLMRRSIAAAAAEVIGTPETTRFAYAGGSLVASALDDHLSRLTGHDGPADHPLDEVLFALYADRATGPLSRARIEAACLEIWQIDIGPWLDRYVYGKETLPRPDSLF